MTEFLSKVEHHGESIDVLIAPGRANRVLELRCVLDHNDFNEISGIEVLDFDSQLGGATIGMSPTLGYPRWSSDPEVDAAYFRVSAARAQHQTLSTAIASISEIGEVVSLRVTSLISRHVQATEWCGSEQFHW